MSAVDVAVVVPTRDRPAALARCLRALATQGHPPAEVVVVDDGSSAADAVAAVVADQPRARLLRAAGDGPAAARNRGAAATSCELVAFTDDDCVPEAGWLGALVEVLAAGADVAAGPTRCGPGAGAADRAAQTITNHLLEESWGSGAPTVGFAPTCNLAVRAAVLAAVPFDEHYPLAAGEDRDWCARIVASGRAISFAPGAALEHRPDLTVPRFWRQQLRYGRGAHRFRAVDEDERGRPSLAFYGRLLGRGLRQGPAVGALVASAQVATAVGVAQEALSERRGAARQR